MENGNAPATKQDVVELRAELKQDVAELRTELKRDVADLRAELKQDVAELKQNDDMLRSEMHHLHDAVLERIADSETNLLKAFYAFAESNQTRLAVVETDADAVKKRVGILEERVLQLERKVNFPQHPTQ